MPVSLSPYFITFLLNLFGGGIVTFGVGAALHGLSLNLVAAYIAIICADTVSDIFYYCLGRFASGALQNKIIKPGSKAAHRFAMVEQYFEKHGATTVFLGKMSDVLAIPAVMLAGIVKMSFAKFLVICTLTTLVKTALILAAGYLIGRSMDTTDAHFAFFGVAGLFLLALVVVMARYFYAAVRAKR